MTRTGAWMYGDDRPQTNQTMLWDGLRDLSDRLTSVIERSSPSAPILVTGDWGSGKSSLLIATQNRLDGRQYLTVRFGAWSYEGEGPLLPLLLRALWQRAPKSLKKGEAKKKWKSLLQSAGQVVAQKGPSVALLTAAVAFQAHYLHPFEPLIHNVFGHGHEKKKDEDAVAVLQREFHWLTSELASRHDGPVVFFIDDLDRCHPAVALALIESLRVLIGADSKGHAAPQARYVIALDRTALIRAVTQKFEGMSLYDGNRYLEKIFPIAFHLPQPKEASILQFVQGFLGSKANSEEEQQDEDRIADILSLALADPIFANPRLMKRCIERFRMVLDFEGKPQEGAGDSDKQDYEDLFLARWIAAGERWPTLRWLFSRHGNDYWLQVARYLGDGQAPLPDDEIVQLLAEQDIQAWLRREFFGTKETRLEAYRRADLRLGRFGL
jgi:predicted KAP-like P-loop ATPase